MSVLKSGGGPPHSNTLARLFMRRLANPPEFWSAAALRRFELRKIRAIRVSFNFFVKRTQASAQFV